MFSDGLRRLLWKDCLTPRLRITGLEGGRMGSCGLTVTEFQQWILSSVGTSGCAAVNIIAATALRATDDQNANMAIYFP